MKSYVTAFAAAGIVLPIGLHVIAADRMPWWPDTVSMGIGFGIVAVVLVWKSRAEREINNRLRNALREWGNAIGRHFGSS